MDSGKFIELGKSIVADYANEKLDKTDGVEISPDDIYIVWLSKTLQNSKGLFSTTLSDGMYYELTFNGNKQEIYLYAYKNFENRAIQVD